VEPGGKKSGEVGKLGDHSEKEKSNFMTSATIRDHGLKAKHRGGVKDDSSLTGGGKNQILRQIWKRKSKKGSNLLPGPRGKRKGLLTGRDCSKKTAPTRP